MKYVGYNETLKLFVVVKRVKKGLLSVQPFLQMLKPIPFVAALKIH
jgi:hypothetical protein